MRWILVVVILNALYSPSFSGLFDDIGGAVTGAADTVGDAVTGGGETVGDAVGTATDYSSSLSDILGYVDDIPEINRVVDAIEGKVDGVTGYVDDIPVIGGAVSSIGAAVNTIKASTDAILDSTLSLAQGIPAVKSIVDAIKGNTESITGKVDIIDGNLDSTLSLAQGIPVVDSIVDTIKVNTESITGKVDIIDGNLDSTLLLAQGIPNVQTSVDDVFVDTTELLDLLKNGLFTVGDIADEVRDLAQTLSTCVGNLAHIADFAVPLTEILDFIDFDAAVFNIDIEEVLFMIFAGPMMPIKSIVEDFCNEGVPAIVSLAAELTQPIADASRRRMFNPAKRRMFENDDCEEDDAFCNPASYSSPYDSGGDYQEMVRFLSDGGLVEDRSDPPPANANIMQRYRAWVFATKMITTVIQDVCNAIDACSPPTKKLGCAVKVDPVSGCHYMKMIFSFAFSIVDYAVASASYHNTRIANAKIATLFDDRDNIIHNQFAVRADLSSKYSSRSLYLNSQYEDRSVDLSSKYESRSLYLNSQYELRSVDLENKFDSSSADRDQKYQLRSEDLQEKFSTASEDRNFKFQSLTSAIAELQGTVDSLPNLNGGSTSSNGNGKANAEHGSVLGALYNEQGDENGFVVIKIKTADFYIVAISAVGFVLIFAAMAMTLIWSHCCYNGQGYRYSRARKYATQSEMDE